MQYCVKSAAVTAWFCDTSRFPHHRWKYAALTLTLDISSCCTLAAHADGCEVTTIEGLSARPEFARMEAAFTRHAALQCGFCTPGMLLTVSSLLATDELPNEDAIKRNLSGNLCRCTGYRGIIEAVADLAGVK